MNSQARLMTRRALFHGAAGTMVAAAATAVVRPDMARGDAALEAKMLVWDSHGHLDSGRTPEESIARSLRIADRMGIQRVVVSMGVSHAYDPSPEQMRRENDDVLRAIRHAPDRVLGYVYLNPKLPAESLAELDRCVGEGPMVGVKLWVAVRCNDPCLDPIVRRAVELKTPILQHTFFRAGGNLPGESTPADLAELAARHPDATLICAHSGADWERGIRAVRAAKNVATDVCGFDPTAGVVEMAVRELGAERVLYGSDFPGRSFASQLAKVYGADISEPARRLILGENLRRMLLPILTAKGVRV